MPDVLIIEDEVLLRHVLAETIASSHYKVRTAGNGRDAMKLMRHQPAHLVITDIIMPDMEGIETIRILRREFPATKIIAISGGGFGEARDYLRIASELGVQKTMAKPFTPSELLDAVKLLLQPPRADANDSAS